MKVDFSAVLLDLDSRPIKQSADLSGPDATLGFVAVLSLQQPVDTPEDKLLAYQLMTRIHGQSVVDVTPEEVTFIKRVIGKHHPSLIYGRCADLLNG